MSLADRIESDIEKVFYRHDDFARYHDWNGRLITCIVDNEQALMHGNLNTLSIEWDVGNIDTIVRIPASALDAKPREGETVFFDGKMKVIRNATDNEGEYIVLMRDYEARGVY